MEHLYQGVLKYKDQTFPSQSDLLQQLESGQSPKSFLVTCSDSRISVNEFTSTNPGEVFVIRNAGNLIPPYNPDSISNEAVTLEYGVQVLKVKEIIICGHQNCGAVHSMKNVESLDALPLIKKALTELSQNFDPKTLKSEPLNQTIGKNIQLQMKNLLSYPFIKEAFLKHDLEIYGWLYHFSSGEITQKFNMRELVNQGEN